MIPTVRASKLEPDGVAGPKDRGVFYFVRTGADVEMHFTFPCCGRQSWIPLRPMGAPHPGDGPAWEWDGNEEAPTVHPSIHYHYETPRGRVTHWHGWLKKGYWETLEDSTCRPK